MRITQEFGYALADLLRDASDAEAVRVLTKAKKFLASRGKEKLFVPIIKETIKILSSSKTTGVVTLAHERDGSTYRDHIARDLADLGVTSYETRTDHTIVSGYIVDGAGTRIDRSVKRRLINLYQSLTVN